METKQIQSMEGRREQKQNEEITLFLTLFRTHTRQFVLRLKGLSVRNHRKYMLDNISRHFWVSNCIRKIGVVFYADYEKHIHFVKSHLGTENHFSTPSSLTLHGGDLKFLLPLSLNLKYATTFIFRMLGF